MVFGLFSFVLVAIVLHRKLCDATPVTLTGNSGFKTGDNLELSCSVNESVDLFSVSFFKNMIETIWINNPASCTFFNLIPDDTSTYSIICDPSQKNFTMIKNGLNTSDDNAVWFCRMVSKAGGNGSCPVANNTCTSLSIILKMIVPTTPATSGPSSQQSLLWLLLLILLIILLIFLIFFCCGCLDCCKFCRNFEHYEVSKSCYMTWYFIKRGCCSFFFCKSGSKRGKCFCGNHKGEHCGGCLYCRKKCTCGWSCNCKGINTSCCGCCFCICCVPARRKEEDPLTVCIDSKDAIFKSVAGKVTISCTVEGCGCGPTQVIWTGPNENELKDKTKYEITLYSEETGKSSLTILAFSSSDSGWYTCQAMDGEEYVVEDCINITAHDNERNTNRTGPPAIHVRTQNRVESEPTNKKTSDRPQPSPPVAVVTEDRSKHRPQPLPPDNSDVKDPSKRGISANFDDKQGLPTGTPRPNRLAPLTQKQALVEKEVASEEKTKKKRKKKKKKGQMNEGNQEDEMVELTSKRTLPETPEDQFDGN